MPALQKNTWQKVRGLAGIIKGVLGMGFSTFIFFNLLVSVSAWAGAVSAGGMQAPPTLECLFRDNNQLSAPFNFLITDTNPPSIQLIQFDFKKQTLLSEKHSHTYLVETEQTGEVLIKMNDTVKMIYNPKKTNTFVQMQKFFENLKVYRNIEFVEMPQYSSARLQIDQIKYEGFCQTGPLFYY